MKIINAKTITKTFKKKDFNYLQVGEQLYTFGNSNEKAPDKYIHSSAKSKKANDGHWLLNNHLKKLVSENFSLFESSDQHAHVLGAYHSD